MLPKYNIDICIIQDIKIKIYCRVKNKTKNKQNNKPKKLIYFSYSKDLKIKLIWDNQKLINRNNTYNNNPFLLLFF